jgi:hypothetical protein
MSSCESLYGIKIDQQHVKKNKYLPEERAKEYKKLRNKLSTNNYRKKKGVANLLAKIKIFLDEKLVSRDYIINFLNDIDLKN